MEFRKATKEQSKLRLALFGPSGSGKTFTALRLATGITGKIAVIDTERGSASKYADRFEFDVLELGKKERDIGHYVQAISAAQEAGYAILIIDSLSHAWFELLDEVERIARTKYKGNTWSAWSEGTPKQRKLVDAILDYNGHIIATMRVKTEWSTEQTSRGKMRPVRIGLAPQQGKGIDYEFDLLGELSYTHTMTISKDRTGRFQDRVIETPGEDMGHELVEWLKDGLPPRPREKAAKPPEKPKKKQEPKNGKTSMQQAAWSYITPGGKMLGKCSLSELETMRTWCKDDEKAQTPAGKTLKGHVIVLIDYLVEQDKTDVPTWPPEVIAAVIEAKLTKNSHSATATLKHSRLTPAYPVDVFVAWFKKYRESKDAGGLTPEAAGVANAWLADAK